MNPILTLSPVAPPAVLGATPLAAVVLAGVAAGAAAGVLEQAAAIIPIAISSPILRFKIPLPLPGSSRWPTNRLPHDRPALVPPGGRASPPQPSPPTISDTMRCWFWRLGTSSPTLRPRR